MRAWRAQYRYIEDIHDVARIETAQRRFLCEGNLDLALPLRWAVYGDEYSITR